MINLDNIKSRFLFTLCIALTKQLLGSLVGEGDEFSPVVDGDAVDDVEDED